MDLMKKIINNKKLMLLAILVIGTIMFFISNFIIGTGNAFMDYLGNMIEGKENNKFNLKLSTIKEFKSEQLMFYVILYLIVFIFLARFYFSFKLAFSDLDKGQHGTRSFESNENLLKQYKMIPSKDKEYEGKGGVIVSAINKKSIIPFKKDTYNLLIDEAPVHTMVIGITRSGKGETFVIPMIDVLSRAKEKPSIVAHDPKGEISGASYHTLIKRGYDVHIFNLMKQDMGMGFNPLQLIIDNWKEGNRDTAEQHTNTIGHTLYHDPNAKDPFWTQSASSLVKAIILAIVEDSIESGEEHKVNMYSVAIFLSTLGSDNDEKTGDNALDLFFQARDIGNPAKEMYATANFSGGNARGSIFAMAMNQLQIFTSEPNARLTSYSSMDLTDVGFGDKPLAVFMVTPDYDSSNHILASIFVSQLYRANAEKSVMETGEMDRHVHFMLDEFGNMPTIEDMDKKVTVGASRGFRFHLIIQAYAQVTAKYGAEASEVIKGNCSNQMYILTQDKGTAEEYSSMLGTKTITDVSRSGQLFSTTKSHSESVKERPLLLPDELLELYLGESVIMRVNKREDLQRNRMKSKPIYNSIESGNYHKFRWEYLADDFDTDIPVLSLPISSKEYNDLNLEDITYISEPKDNDSYIQIKKLLTKKEINELRYMLNSFSKTTRDYQDLEEYSPLQLLSYIVYVLRPDPEYFEEQFKPIPKRNSLNLEAFCTENILNTWKQRLSFVIEAKGINLEKPPEVRKGSSQKSQQAKAN